MSFLRIYFAFAAGYLLSYLFRTVNAVISPELSRDLSLNPSSLGLLTSAYFLAFGAAQLPVGMLLDRYGPRRVEPVLLSIAALGALLFAYAESLAGLAFARAVIGLGVCACLMAPLKAIATWFPRERQASLSGWMMVAGGLGALAATTPLEMALRVAHWRTIFVDPGGGDVRRRARDRVARARHRQARACNGLCAHSGRACEPSSGIRVSGGSRRWRPSAWDRSWRSRACGRCRG